MNTTLDQPVPRDIREQMIRRIENAPEDFVLLVHQVLLRVEKEALWREIQTGAEADAASGKLDRIPEMIRAVRAARRSA